MVDIKLRPRPGMLLLVGQFTFSIRRCAAHVESL